MPIEIAGITIDRIHRLSTLESAEFAEHQVPGLEGTVYQDTGRQSVRLLVEGICYGDARQDDLEKLRDIYKKRQESDFIAEIIGQAYFSQVIIDRFEVLQHSGDPDQYSFRMILAEYVPPPAPESAAGLPDVDSLLESDALDFMDMIQLPDLLSFPGFGDPTTPLTGILDNVKSSFGAAGDFSGLAGLFGGGNGAKDIGDSSLVQQISGLDTGTITDLLKGQLDKLLEGGQLTDNLQSSGGKFDVVRNLISGTSIPDLDQTALFNKGFDAISSLLPQDLSGVFGGLDGQMEEFFTDLQSSLSDPMGGFIDNFKALQKLLPDTGGNGTNGGSSNKDLSLKVKPPPPSDGFDPTLITSAANSLLAILPDPLDALHLLTFINTTLAAIPRENIPIRNLPILDDLRDKLETVLKWLTENPSALSNDIASTLDAFNAYIRKQIIEYPILPVTGIITNLQNNSSLTDTKQNISALIGDLNKLSDAAVLGSLSTETAIINGLNARVDAFNATIDKINANWNSDEGKKLTGMLATVDISLEEGMAGLLVLGMPSPDLSLIASAVNPLNQLFDNLGIESFISGIKSLGDAVSRLLDLLDLTQISESVKSALDDASKKITGFSDTLIKTTTDIAMLLNRVAKTIESSGVKAAVDDLQGILNRFEEDVVNGINNIFEPVKKMLLDAFSTITGFVKDLDPGAIVGDVTSLLDNLTGILGNQALLKTIQDIKTALGDLNKTLSQVDFKSVTDEVVKGIGVVKDAFTIAAALPLPDSVVSEVKPALGLLPSASEMGSLAGKLEDGLSSVIDDGPKDILLEIKDKPAELKKEIEKFAPDNFLNDQFFAPYTDFIAKLDTVKPSQLLAPVTDELDNFTGKLKEFDPGSIFGVLEEPYQTLYDAFNSLNPDSLITTLNDKIKDGISTITSNLPLDATDAVFAVIDSINSYINQAVSIAEQVEIALDSVNTRLSGLSKCDDQIRQWGDQVTAKINSLSDISAISVSFEAINSTLTEIGGTALQHRLIDPVQALLAGITDLDPKNSLSALAQAKNRLEPLVTGLPDSLEKTSLLSVLASFDPMSTRYIEAFGGLGDIADDINKNCIENLNDITKYPPSGFFTYWDNHYFQPNGPLSKYRLQNITLDNLKKLISDTITGELTGMLAPVFRIVGQFQALTGAILTELSGLLGNIKDKLKSLQKITDALKEIQACIKAVVDLLNKLDFTVIGKEIQHIFNAIDDQLKAVDPKNIGKMIKDAFDGFLNAINADKLFGLSDLDKKYQELRNALADCNPEEIIKKGLQPEFDKIIGFVELLDIGSDIDTFLKNIDNLESQMKDELDKVVKAYGDMIGAIPDSLQENVGTSYSMPTT